MLIGNSLTFTLEEKENKTRVLAEQNGFDLESDMSLTLTLAWVNILKV
jgi:hypothetical protein